MPSTGSTPLSRSSTRRTAVSLAARNGTLQRRPRPRSTRSSARSCANAIREPRPATSSTRSRSRSRRAQPRRRPARSSPRHRAPPRRAVESVRRPRVDPRPPARPPRRPRAVPAGDDDLLTRDAYESIRTAQRSMTLRQVLRPIDVDADTRTYRLEPGHVITTMLSVTNTRRTGPRPLRPVTTTDGASRTRPAARPRAGQHVRPRQPHVPGAALLDLGDPRRGTGCSTLRAHPAVHQRPAADPPDRRGGRAETGRRPSGTSAATVIVPG